MQTTTRSNFSTIKTEGAILPADLLQRIADGRDLDGLRPEDYHLGARERLNEAISRSWNRLLGVWQSFDEARQALDDAEPGTTLTRERWLLILFQELGYGRLPFRGGVSLDGKGASDDETRRYPISHEYEGVPIHLVSFRQPLDRTDVGQAQRRRSPHSLVQEFLNRSEDALWGFASNGLVLRVLRDNASLTRPAFLEFDLEAMMAGELFADFSLLWLIAHQSRVERQIIKRPRAAAGKKGKPRAAGEEEAEGDEEGTVAQPSKPTAADCWLEWWSQDSAERGTRALDSLRDGVQQAIEALGRGFLAHPGNGALRGQLQTGTLSTADYYRQLLRLVYRLIFLFVAEDRNLLLTPETNPVARDRYYAHYSLTRLRDLAARRRSGPHPDLYRGLRMVFVELREGFLPLGLPALGGFLFSGRATPELDVADIANEALLEAIRDLAFTIEGRVLRPVDYRNLGAEELGSVYESLLELHPQLNAAAATFSLQSAAGSERKTTGSYYTPTSLINSLLDSALEPVVAARLAAAREQMKRGIGNREQGTGKRRGEDGQINPIVPRPGGLAGEHGSGGGSLPADERISSRGTIRHDLPNPPSGIIDSGQHRRGLRSGEPERLHALSENIAGFPEGVGDSFDAGSTSRPDDSSRRPFASGSDGNSGQDVVGADSGPGEEGRVGSGVERSSPHSPFPTPHSLLEEAILSIKVVDPAAGSGHFLIAAANRLATHLARIRTGDSEPSPADRRDALRDVAGRCLYGVDLNEMAVELCKVSLWLETLDPGKPLSFLDHHIRHGNSLIGATPALLRGGIPDEAFAPLTSDDKAYVSEWKKRNKKEREGQAMLPLDAAPWLRLGDFATAVAALEDAPDDTPAAVRAKEAAWERLVNSGDYENNRLLADAWCAAFVFPKHYNVDFPISENDFRDIERNPHSVPRWMKEDIVRLRERYRFFHWHLAFPEVFRPVEGSKGIGSGGIGNRGEAIASGRHSPFPDPHSPTPSASPTGWTGGFDVVLGNPPWERIKLQEKEWFATRDEAIATAPNAAARGRLIAALQKENPTLYESFLDDRRAAEGESHIIRNSGRYPLCGRGDVNTYTIFAELARHLAAPRGRAGIIVPSGIATDDTTKFYFQDIVETGSLASLYDFENREAIFPGVHRSYKFSLLTLRGMGNREWGMGNREGGSAPAPYSLSPDPNSPLPDPSPPAEFVFFALRVADLNDPERRFTLTAEEIALLNPNTRTCPIFRSKRDAELTKAIYRRVPVLIREGDPDGNPWGISFLRMFDMSSDSHLFRTRAGLEKAGYQLVGNRFEQDTSRKPPGHPQLTPDHYLPLYEAKMLHHFDHRWATYEGGDTRDVAANERDDPAFVIFPRYWVSMGEVNRRVGHSWKSNWLLGWRKIARSTDIRTFISSIFPVSGYSDSGILGFPTVASSELGLCLLGNLASMVLDYVVRQKLGGTNMAHFISQQLPIIKPSDYLLVDLPLSESHKLRDWILRRGLELTYTAYDLGSFAEDCGYHGPPFRWDEDRRFLIRCELDAAYFHLYGIERDDVDYIMDTFPIVRRKDEAAHGEYRTKRVILEIYDEMAERIRNYELGIRNEEGYRTRLEPPPGDPRAAHPWDEAWLGPERPVEEWWERPDTKYEIRDTGEVSSDEFRVTIEEKGAAAGRQEALGDRSRQWSAGDLSSLPRELIFADAEGLWHAEENMLFACALRFDGYRYQSEAGQDLSAMLTALLEKDEMPEGDEQRLAVFFYLQRGLGKWGLERATADSRYWGAFRRLYLSIHDRPIPETYGEPYFMKAWAENYGDRAEAWAAVVGRIHAATVYVDDTAGFSESRDALAAHRAVLAEVASARRQVAGSESVTGPPLELRPPPVKEKKAKRGNRGVGSKGVGEGTLTPSIPHSPTPVSPAPIGPRNVRLRRAMELGKDISAAATAELVAFLADEDSSIRWLAGSSLAQRSDAAGVVAAIEAFVRAAEAKRLAVAREEMRRVLEMIMDAAEDEAAREAAGRVLEEM